MKWIDRLSAVGTSALFIFTMWSDLFLPSVEYPSGLLIVLTLWACGAFPIYLRYRVG